MRTFGALVLVLSMIPSVAAADRVPSPPDDCPDGSEGRTGHSGTWCAPTTCETDADCRPEAPRCAEAALCVEIETYTLGGRVRDRSPRQRAVARGACMDGECPGAAECQTGLRCVAAEAAPAAPAPEAASDDEAAPAPAPEAAASEDGGGGGCSVGAGRDGVRGLGWAVVLGLVIGWRRWGWGEG